MMLFKPSIEVVHPIFGYRFRSKLEAIWAVFLEALGIRYEYETYTAVDDGGKWHVPDFYLPAVSQFLEVKPDREVLRKEMFLMQGAAFEKQYKARLAARRDYYLDALNFVRQKLESEPNVVIDEFNDVLVDGKYTWTLSTYAMFVAWGLADAEYPVPDLVKDYSLTRIWKERDLTTAMALEMEHDWTIDDFTVVYGSPQTTSQWKVDSPNCSSTRFSTGRNRALDLRDEAWAMGNLTWGGVDNIFGWDLRDFKEASQDDRDVKAHNRAARLANSARFDHGVNYFIELEKWRNMHDEAWAVYEVSA